MMLYSIGRIGVPLFFMVSGYLMLQKEEPLVLFYTKRMRKVLIPLLFWSLIYAIFVRFVMHKEMTFSLNTPIFYHLWFLYVILFLYLITPVLSAIRKSKYGKRIFTLSVGIWFILFILSPFLSKHFESTHTLYYPYGTYFIGFIGYYLLGYLLGDIKIEAKKAWRLSLVLFVFCMMLTVYLSYDAARLTHTFDSFYSGYYSLLVFVATLSAFFMLRYRANRPVLREQITILATLSFGIYLIHPIFLALLKRLFGFSSLPQNAPYILPVALLTLTLSAFTISLMRKSKTLKRVVP